MRWNDAQEDLNNKQSAASTDYTTSYQELRVAGISRIARMCHKSSASTCI